VLRQFPTLIFPRSKPLAPGVGTTVPGGRANREAHLVMAIAADSGLVRDRSDSSTDPFLDERAYPGAPAALTHRILLSSNTLQA